MTTFTDNTGREWRITINAPAVRAVREHYAWFLRGPAADTFERLSHNAEALVNVLFLLCLRQADAAQVTDEDFARALAGYPLAAATSALIQAVLEWVPPQERRVLQEAARTQSSLRRQAENKALRRVDRKRRKRVKREL